MTHHAHWRDVSLGHFASYRYSNDVLLPNVIAVFVGLQ